MDVQNQASPKDPATDVILSVNMTSPPSAAVSHNYPDAFLNSCFGSDAGTVDAASLSSEISKPTEPSAAELPHIKDGGLHIDTNSAEWQQSSIDMNGAAHSESAPKLPLTVLSTSDQTNTSTGEGEDSNFHLELYTLFDHNSTSVAPSDAMLWSLFSPENEPQRASYLPDYPM